MKTLYNKITISKELDDFFFPVGKHNLYFDKDSFDEKKKFQPLIPNRPKYADKFKAVVDEERWNMLECVSNSYTLITNNWAYMQGLDAALMIFPYQNIGIHFIYGELTEDRGACTMNFLIEKEIYISGVDNRWHACLHIENSYNKTTSLRYMVGFFLEKMEEKKIPIGMLIPSLSLEYSANHGWSLNTIERKLKETIFDKYHGLDVFDEFERMVRELVAIEVIDDEVLPLFCKLANIKRLNVESQKDRDLAFVLINIDKVAKKWIDKCNYNAYAALCAYAEFASDFADQISMLFKQPSECQSMLGKLMDDLIRKKHEYGKDFSLDKFIGEEGRYVNKQIKLICRK